jgi:hypothetical protein
MQAALALVFTSFVLSLAALRYRKPGGKLWSPIWRMKDHYEPRGVVLNAVALSLLLAGAVCYLLAAPP